MKSLKHHKDAFNIIKRFHKLDHSMIPVTLLCSIVGGVIPFIPIVLSQRILECVIEKNYIEALKFAVIMAILVFLGGSILAYIKKVMINKAQEVSMKIEDLVHQKPLTIDYQSIENGEIIKEITSVTSMLRYRGNYQSLLNRYMEFMQNVISCILALGLSIELCLSVGEIENEFLRAVTNPLLTILLIVFIILGATGIVGRVMEWSHKKVRESFEEGLKCENMLRYLFRTIKDDSSVKLIQSYKGEEFIQSVYKKVMGESQKYYKTQGDYGIVEGVVQDLMGGVITVLAYGIVTLKILTNAIGIGAFLKYSQAIIKMNQAIVEIVALNEGIKDVTGYLVKVVEFLDYENKFETGSIPIEKRSDFKYQISFEDVWFKYPKTEEYVLKGVSCNLSFNKKSALVGRNGAGKSTFIKLLCRLYEPTKGRITLNGIDIRKYDYEEYKSLFSVVFQDFGLMAFSLGENISNTVNFDKSKVKKCLVKSGLDKFTDRVDLEDKEVLMDVGADDTMIKYSGGEKQKIALARALYKDAPFVILDEPTAALDPISEYDIYQRFNSMVGEKSCVYISHRMSSCRFCEDIIVLDNGNIVERGNHEELIAADELYKEMWDAQAKYYIAS